MQGVDTARVVDAMITVHKTHASDTSVAVIRRFFENDHVHMALVVAENGRLVTTVERSDLLEPVAEGASAAQLGTLEGRIARASDPLGALTVRLRREGRRRMAVVDDDGTLLGLLCFKRSGQGYCSDEGVRARELERECEPTIGTGGPCADAR